MTVERISRRAVLRGLGAAVALPWLEAMAPSPLARAASIVAQGPRRLAFLYVPNGVHMPDWTPAREGKGYDLPPILEPLTRFRDDFSVLTGLNQDNASSKGDGTGDHARSMASFLTGAHPKKTEGSNIQAGISVDQIAAKKLGRATRFASLELGCDRGGSSGACDSGYSCAYSTNLSWRSASMPSPKEINPRHLFDRLFGAAGAGQSRSEQDRARRRRSSLLDLVSEDAHRLRDRLGANDRRKVDEYLTGVRELEVRIAQSEAPPPDAPRDFARPAGIPIEYTEHVALMIDLMALAFQGDQTRIATFVFANELSGRSYAFLGVPEGHHDLSHHGGDPQKHAKLRIINRFHIEQFGRLLAKLKAAPDGESTVLGNSMIVYGSGISDGNSHNHDNLPILLAGSGGGAIAPGRHIRYSNKTPLNNLFLSMLDHAGAPISSVGDSTGRLPDF